MNNFEIKKKAYKLISDFINSAFSSGWELSENDEESILIGEEISNLQKEFLKISNFTEDKYELYLELQEIKRKQREMKEAMTFDGVLRINHKAEEDLKQLTDFISNGELCK